LATLSPGPVPLPLLDRGAAVSHRDALVEELKNYRRNINIASGYVSFEPWREADHDDLLFAVCLALWGWRQREPQWALRVVA
jgi:hypothetical protein